MTRKTVIDFAYRQGLSVEQVSQFVGENWLRPTILSNVDFYHWQFVQPFDGGDRDHCVVALVDGEIAGFLGLNKRRFDLDDEPVEGAELTTWIVKEKFRGTGIAGRMLEFVKSNFEIAVGANITKDAVGPYIRAGYRFLREVPRLLRVYEFDKLHPLGPIDTNIRKAYGARPDRSPTVPTFSRIDFSEIDGSWPRRFARSRGNLLWRYARHPVFQYHALQLGSSDTIIYRIQNVAGVNVMIVLEVLCSDRPHVDFIKALDCFALSEGIDLVEFFSTDVWLNERLVGLGFIPCLDLRDFIDLAFLYNPLERRSAKSYSLILHIGDTLVSRGFGLDSIHVTKGDSDMDRPTPSSLTGVLPS
jgi:GNAT superfamily N-acetyltransferase